MYNKCLKDPVGLPKKAKKQINKVREKSENRR